MGYVSHELRTATCGLTGGSSGCCGVASAAHMPASPLWSLLTGTPRGRHAAPLAASACCFWRLFRSSPGSPASTAGWHAAGLADAGGRGSHAVHAHARCAAGLAGRISAACGWRVLAVGGWAVMLVGCSHMTAAGGKHQLRTQQHAPNIAAVSKMRTAVPNNTNPCTRPPP